MVYQRRRDRPRNLVRAAEASRLHEELLVQAYHVLLPKLAWQRPAPTRPPRPPWAAAAADRLPVPLIGG